MPEKEVPRLCAFCIHYHIMVTPHAGSGGAGPFCKFYNKFFPEPRRWLYNPLKKKPGERTCKNWHA